MKHLRFIPITAFLLAVIFATGSAFSLKPQKENRPDCVWYKLKRTAQNPNPDIEVNTNYEKLPAGDIEAQCPDEDVVCAVCLPDNPGQTYPAASNFTPAFKESLHNAERDNLETAVIELFEQ